MKQQSLRILCNYAFGLALSLLALPACAQADPNAPARQLAAKVRDRLLHPIVEYCRLEYPTNATLMKSRYAKFSQEFDEKLKREQLPILPEDISTRLDSEDGLKVFANLRDKLQQITRTGSPKSNCQSFADELRKEEAVARFVAIFRNMLLKIGASVTRPPTPPAAMPSVE